MRARCAMLALAASAAMGCAAVERIPDKPRPQAKLETVSFTTLFNQVVYSSPAFPNAPVDRALMQRVLVSPNVVFESSRSSLAEAVVTGPPASQPAAPGMGHALGKPISAQLSGMLLRFLMSKGTVVLAPAVMRRWCGEGCAVNSWVERLLLLYRVGAKGIEPERVGDPAMLPTSLLAVRQLEAGPSPLDVYVVRNREHQRMEVKLHPGEGDSILCYLPEVPVPAVWFQAEMVSIRDGRILARVDERVTAATTAALDVDVVAVEWKPVRSRESSGIRSYEYVSSWEPERILCATVRQELQGLVARNGDLRDPSDQVRRIISGSLARLFPPTATGVK
jgi:hypothetical protein